MYKVALSREAERYYQRCDKTISKKLARAFEAIEKSPRAGNNIKTLKGKLSGSYRYRVGDYRIVYTINEAIVTVFVITIANRKDVYD